MNDHIEKNQKKQPLKQVLAAKKADFEAKASNSLKRIYGEGIKSVERSGILANAMKMGEKAPDFTLHNAFGKPVSLSDYLVRGPVILTWYRGGWCPYCNLTLKRLQEELPNFKAMGANLLALTPELPDKSLTTLEKHGLQFEVLTDTGNKTARKYGIVYKLTLDVANWYQESFDFHGINGDTSDELPLAATYVIDTDGIIKYTFLDVDYRNRAEPSEILNELEVLKKIKKQGN